MSPGNRNSLHAIRKPTHFSPAIAAAIFALGVAVISMACVSAQFGTLMPQTTPAAEAAQCSPEVNTHSLAQAHDGRAKVLDSNQLAVRPGN